MLYEVITFIATEGNEFDFKLFEDKGLNSVVYEKKVLNNEAHCFRLGYSYEPGKKYYWSVGSRSVEHAASEFETGIDFDTPFITPAEHIKCPKIFKEISLDGKIESARLHVTGLGMYRAFINGERAGDSYLTPGYNDYDAYLRYQTYDVRNNFV